MGRGWRGGPGVGVGGRGGAGGERGTLVGGWGGTRTVRGVGGGGDGGGAHGRGGGPGGGVPRGRCGRGCRVSVGGGGHPQRPLPRPSAPPAAFGQRCVGGGTPLLCHGTRGAPSPPHAAVPPVPIRGGRPCPTATAAPRSRDPPRPHPSKAHRFPPPTQRLGPPHSGGCLGRGVGLGVRAMPGVGGWRGGRNHSGYFGGGGMDEVVAMETALCWAGC